MQWQFFLGACFLTGALLLPHAPGIPVIVGMMVAGIVHVVWFRISRHRNRRS
jgi:hypothetical protein